MRQRAAVPVGERFGCWEVMAGTEIKDRWGAYLWRCRCACGHIQNMLPKHVRKSVRTTACRRCATNKMALTPTGRHEGAAR